MKRFIGVKIVEAKPMMRGDYNDFKRWTIPDDENPSDDGYLVKYSDEYISWCPKEQFEKHNSPCDGMIFGHAVEAAKLGHKVARKGWNGNGMHMDCQFPDANSKMTHPYMVMHIPGCEEGTRLLPWQPAQVDVFAEDWGIV